MDNWLNDDLRELLVLLVPMLISTVLGSAWWGKQHWTLRVAGRMAAPIVRDLMERKVAPLKEANQAAGGAYDLSEREGAAVLSEAKERLRDHLTLHDLNKKPLVPKVAPVLVNNDKKLEAVIEKEVVRQKRIPHSRVRPGGKGFR